MGVMNPYQSPESRDRPPFTRRRSLGLIILSGIMFAAAAFPPVAVVVKPPERSDVVLSAAIMAWTMLLASLGTFWLGWRRWRVSVPGRRASQPDDRDSNPRPGRQTELQPPGEHADSGTYSRRDREIDDWLA
jgi:hypothetical protein